jgi:dihydroorotate dehydrogenase electron transfer subunit
MLALVEEVKEMGPGVFKLKLKTSAAKKAKPGQFVHLKITSSFFPFLRRPMSIHYAHPPSGKLEILYKVVGKGTEILSQKRRGEEIDLLGPLGQGYPLTRHQKVLIVAGGLGVSPLLYLAVLLRRKKKEVFFLLGAQNKKRLFGKDVLEEIGCHLKIATEDGTEGIAGKVTDLLPQVLPFSPGVVYACGPQPMYQELKKWQEKLSARIYVSLEERMACGQGFCWGCVVLTKNGYQRVCTEGPVFELTQLQKLEEDERK